MRGAVLLGLTLYLTTWATARNPRDPRIVRGSTSHTSGTLSHEIVEIPAGPHGDTLLSTAPAINETECTPLFELQLSPYWLAQRVDRERRVTEIFSNHTLDDNIVYKYEIDTNLNVVSSPTSLSIVIPDIADDLDRDGHVELVCQRIDELLIYSSPDWEVRGRFRWPGLNVDMTPTAVNVDADPYIEIYITPNSLSGFGGVAVIDFDPASQEFYVASQILAPFGAVGQSAIADFDSDGRVEFITGNGSFGYELYEWTTTGIQYVGHVTDSSDGSHLFAVACRPFPGGEVHALLGRSLAGQFRYELLVATGDNQFQIVQSFVEFTGATGTTPCSAADTDCDGLDELAMTFYTPRNQLWEWNVDADSFEVKCAWDQEVYGSFRDWYTVDLNFDGIPEWGTLNHNSLFRVFADTSCQGCDSAGYCPLPSPLCHCVCHADPSCDGVKSDIVDVVTVIGVAFRAGELIHDDDCSRLRCDVNCSGNVDVVDVVSVIDVSFRGEPAQSAYCDPCIPSSP